MKALLRRGIDLRVAPIYVILALGLPLLIIALAHYLALGLGLEVATTLFPTENAPPPVIIAIPYFFFALLFGGGLEEYDWRWYQQWDGERGTDRSVGLSGLP